MHFVKIGSRAINMDNVLHIEQQQWHDSMTLKIYFVGQPATPLVLTDEEAQHLAGYIEYVAQPPLTLR